MTQSQPNNQISIVIPAYNAVGKIEATLESIFAQTCPAAEIIIVDDGSSDATADLLKRYQPRVQVIRQENAGPGAARNAGVAAAKGDWIAFCDSDDLWRADKLSTQSSTIDQNPNIDLIFSNVTFEKDGTLGETSAPIEDVWDADAILELLGKEILFPSTMLVKRDCFLNVGGFQEEFRVGEDIDLTLRLLPECHTVFLGQPLAIHRVFTDSLSRSQDAEKGNLYLVAAYERSLKQAQKASTFQREYVRNKLSSYYYDLAYDCIARRRMKYLYKSWYFNRSSPTSALRLLRSVVWDWRLERSAGPDVAPYRRFC